MAVHAGELEAVREHGKLFLVLVRAHSLVHGSQRRFGDLQCATQRRRVGMVGLGVAQDLYATVSRTSEVRKISRRTRLIDEQRIACEPLHRLEEEVFQLQSLDAQALQTRALADCSPGSHVDVTYVQQGPQ